MESSRLRCWAELSFLHAHSISRSIAQWDQEAVWTELDRTGELAKKLNQAQLFQKLQLVLFSSICLQVHNDTRLNAYKDLEGSERW